MAVLALSLAGQAIGGAIGGSFLGISAATLGGAAGGLIGQALFGPKTPDQKGPRIKDLDTSTASEGTDIPIMLGTMRIAGQIIWAPPLTERTRKVRSGKGFLGGGSSTSRTYYATGTWAVRFGYTRNGNARQLRKVWANKELVYDATSGSVQTFKENFDFTYYDGTQTTPDPTMEGIIGEGNVPAYTGQAMMVFEDLNLEAYGNHIPSIEAELVEEGVNAPTLTRLNLQTLYDYTQPISNGRIEYDPIRQLVYCSFYGALFNDFGAVFAVNPWTRKIVWKRLFDDYPGLTGGTGVTYLISNTSKYDRLAILRGDYFEIYDASNFQYLGISGDISNILGSELSLFQGVFGFGSSAFYYWAGDTSAATAVSIPTGYSATNFQGAVASVAVDVDGVRVPTSDVAHVFCYASGSNTRHGYFKISQTPSISFTTVVASYVSAAADESVAGLTLPDGFFASQGVYSAASDSYWFPFTYTGGSPNTPWLVEVSVETGEILGLYDMRARSGNGSFSWGAAVGHPLVSYDATTRSLWFTGTGTGVCSFNVVTKAMSCNNPNEGNSPIYYHPPTGTAIGEEYGDVDPFYARIWFFKINNVDQTGVAISSAVRFFATEVGVASSDITFSYFSTTVTGVISNRRTAARDIINRCLQYEIADGYESEYKLKFVGRGGPVAATLDADYLGAVPFGEMPKSTEMLAPHEIELPRLLDLKFYNASNDFQIGDALAVWHTGASDRKTTLDMPLGITANQALQRANLLLHALYQQQQFSASWGPRYAQLEPTDVVTLPFNARLERARIERVNRGVNGVRDVLLTYDRTEDVITYASAAGDTTRTVGIRGGGGVLPLWMDTPLLRDSDTNAPGPYVAVYDYASGFPAGFMYTSPDDATYIESARFDSEPAWGFAQGAPSDIVSFGVWDLDNTISVQFIDNAGDVESATSAVVFAGGNAGAWGRPGRWEIVQWLSAATASSGAKQLTSLLRGRRGTDAYVNTHQDGDFFVVLNASDMDRLDYAVADIGDTVYVRTVPPGSSYADVTPAVFSVTGTPLKPYSPISAIVASASTGGDLLATWTRRTRIGGSYQGLYDQVGGTLSEDSEQYEVDIINPATGSTVASGYTTGSTAFLYASASQVADGADRLGTVSFNIFQISAAVGRGFPASTTYERPWETGIKWALNLGVDYYIPLDDAGTSTMAEYFGSAVGVWGVASTGVASGEWIGALQRAPASIAADSSTSIGTIGDLIMNWGNGKKTISVGMWFKRPGAATGGRLLSSPGAASLNEAIGFTDNVQVVLRPKGSSGTGANVNITPDSFEDDNPLFALITVNTSTRSANGYMNGELVGSTTWGAGASWHANPIQWTGYSSTYPGRIGALINGTANPYTGKVSDIQLYPTELTEAQVSTLYIKQQGYRDRVGSLGATHYWSIDHRSTVTTAPDLIGSADIDFASFAAARNPVHKCVRYGGDFEATNYAYAPIVADMRTQRFSIEAWVSFESIGTNQPWLTFWPAGAYASAKGVQFLVDSTNGIRARYGDNGDGVFRYLNASATTGKPYHVVFAKASAGAAPTLYVNAVATTGASAVTIDWTEATGTPAPPSGTVYFNRSNQAATASVAPDQNGGDVWLNSVAFYSSVLISSAVASATYKFGLKQL